MQGRVAKNEEEIIPTEKWLASFRKNGRQFIRQFRAEGYYEAYDRVLTYAERRKAEILWFKEKRECGSRYMNRNYPELESVCVYCRALFNETEPVPCLNETCQSQFCSKTCMQGHYIFRHDNRVANTKL
ncbi:MAG: hypothetical protein QXU32_05420 [Nitrososphaerales archaeon]